MFQGYQLRVKILGSHFVRACTFDRFARSRVGQCLERRCLEVHSVQGFERSVEVEYQVPTSSRCDQDDEGVIVVDSEEDDERCSGTMYRVRH